MQAAVWDTYVKRRNGDVLHFDILAPDSETDAERIFSYGHAYLETQNETDALLDIQQCRFCHVEEITVPMQEAFASQGYYIIDLGTIPASVPENPSRRDMILHLRAHYAQYRFADFQHKTNEEIAALLQQELAR